MIPKVIHYCWFGGKEMPKLAKKCLKSWKKYCSDYEIVCWNESNFNIDECPLYVRQAYENKKWAFVTDYVRLKIIFENGGIYLDTDVEIIKKLDKFLNYNAFFGFENGECVNTGIGFGAVPKNEIIKELMEQYNDLLFVKEDGSLDLLPCPMRNTEVFINNSLVPDDKFQLLKNNIAIFPSEYFCPINSITKEKNITSNTHTIHWFSASWIPLKIKIKKKIFKIESFILGKENAIKFNNIIKGRKICKKN